MRLRNIPGANERIAADEHVIQLPETKNGRWSEVFGNHHPIHIEIGMGKGIFIQTQAMKNPDINYIGIEKYSSVLIRALDKREEVEINNLYYLCMNAEVIDQVFGNGEVEKIYLNFSDPWPKDRHSRRRLTSREFFQRYDQILAPDGVVEFKTDNRSLFDFSLEEVVEAGWRVDNYTYDLHNSIYVGGNIMTEYEERFSSQGVPINRLVASRKMN